MGFERATGLSRMVLTPVYTGLEEEKKTKKGKKRGRHMAAESHHVPRPTSSWNYALKPA